MSSSKELIESIESLGVRIYIPTYGRVGEQKTIHFFPKELYGSVVNLVAPSHEDHGELPVIVIPDEHEGSIAKKRQWILEYSNSLNECCHVQIDDLVTFSRRVDKKEENIEKFSLEEVYFILKRFKEDVENDIWCSSLNLRYMHNTFEDIETKPTRTGKMVCYKNEILERDYRFDEVTVFEDAHVALSIIEHGHKTKLYSDFIASNFPGVSSGGTRLDSNFEVSRYEEGLKHFASLHPMVQVLESDGKFYGRVSSIKLKFFWVKSFGIKSEATLW